MGCDVVWYDMMWTIYSFYVPHMKNKSEGGEYVVKYKIYFVYTIDIAPYTVQCDNVFT